VLFRSSIVRASQEGLQCVLFKPFQVTKLLDEVREAIVVSTGRASTESGDVSADS